jgi:hypothetical protein
MNAEISRAMCVDGYEAQLQLQTALHFGCHVVQDSQYWREIMAETLTSTSAPRLHIHNHGPGSKGSRKSKQRGRRHRKELLACDN